MLTSYNNFLFEHNLRSDTQELTEKDFSIILNSENVDFSLDDKPIWRALRNKALDNNKIYLINPKLYKRPAAYTQNYYMLLMDNLQCWKEYPKRYNSLICTTNENHAYEFSLGTENVFRVIPYKDANIGMCDNYDLWLSFKYALNKLKINDLSYFNNRLRKIFNILCYDDLDQNNYYIFTKQLHILDEKLKKVTLDKMNDLYDEIYTFKDISIEFDGLIKAFEHYFNPDLNNFKLITYGEYKNVKNYDNKELWTDSTSILISQKNLNKMNII